MNDPSERLFPCCNRLETTALKLYDEGDAGTRRNPLGHERMRLPGYSILAPVLQAFAAEYPLKGLAARDNESCLKAYDLEFARRRSDS